MVGIVVLFPFYNSKKKRKLRSIAHKMSEMIKHRGSDIEVFCDDDVVLLSCRHENEHKQLISSEDSTLIAVCDGKIYSHNMPVSRLLGHMFTNTLEAIPNLYEAAANFAGLVDGEFAIVVYNSKSKELILIRDRMGTRPLYYTVLDNILVVSSEIKALLQFPGVENKADPRSILDFFSLGEVLGNKTFFKKIKRVEAGSMIMFDKSGNHKITKYWNPIFTDSLENEARAVISLQEDLRKAIKERTLDVKAPCCSYLSGGLDSTCMSYFLSSIISGRLRTFNIDFEGVPGEHPYALRVSRNISSIHNCKEIHPSDFFSALINNIWFSETIRKGDSSSAYYFGASLVSNYSDTVFSGEGFDEFLCGYPVQLKIKIYDLLHSFSLLKNPFEIAELIRWLVTIVINRKFKEMLGLIRFLHDKRTKNAILLFQLNSSSDLEKLFKDEFWQEVRDYDPVKELLTVLDCKDRSLQELYRSYQVRVRLPNRMRVIHGCHSAFSVQVRYPSLGAINTMTKIDPDLLIKKMKTKSILRRLLEQEGISSEIVWRPKTGFSVPIGHWLRRNKLKDFVKKLFASDIIEKEGFFKADYVKRIVDEHLSGKEDHYLLISLLINFELFYRIFIDKEKDFLMRALEK